MDHSEGQRFMAKLQKSRRPLGRNPVVAVRVPPPLRQEIIEEAKAAERTMSAEVEALLRAALDFRKRFPDSVAAQAIEATTFPFLRGGETYARDIGKVHPWSGDLAARREAAVAGCQQLISFVSADPQQQKWALDSLLHRVAFVHFNFPPRGGDAP